ncbi:MAG TPA: hypothetical protein VN982_14130 [Candidatus Dormibacteraeota bacterium]|nr:hypothetical protein [Candidatus Dormibacteraeota bacterium]
MESKIIFDIAAEHFDWKAVEAPAALFIAGCLGILMEKLKWVHIVIKNVGYYLAGFALLTAAYVFIDSYVLRRDHVKALTSGECEVVEGIVEHFHPMYYEGRKDESFVISGHTFRYSDHIATTCFNRPSAHGGSIHGGMYLRITYIDDCILRVTSLEPESRVFTR